MFENTAKSKFTISYTTFPKFFQSETPKKDLACTCSMVLIVDDD